MNRCQAGPLGYLRCLPAAFGETVKESAVSTLSQSGRRTWIVLGSPLAVIRYTPCTPILFKFPEGKAAIVHIRIAIIDVLARNEILHREYDGRK